MRCGKSPEETLMSMVDQMLVAPDAVADWIVSNATANECRQLEPKATTCFEAHADAVRAETLLKNQAELAVAEAISRFVEQRLNR